MNYIIFFKLRKEIGLPTSKRHTSSNHARPRQESLPEEAGAEPAAPAPEALPSSPLRPPSKSKPVGAASQSWTPPPAKCNEATCSSSTSSSGGASQVSHPDEHASIYPSTTSQARLARGLPSSAASISQQACEERGLASKAVLSNLVQAYCSIIHADHRSQ